MLFISTFYTTNPVILLLLFLGRLAFQVVPNILDGSGIHREVYTANDRVQADDSMGTYSQSVLESR